MVNFSAPSLDPPIYLPCKSAGSSWPLLATRSRARPAAVGPARVATVVATSEVRDRPLHIITNHCMPMRTNPYIVTTLPSRGPHGRGHRPA